MMRTEAIQCLEEGKWEMIDILLNTAIFAVTVFLLVRFARKDGKWAPDRLRVAFRFFTVQSNVLCAAAALAAAAGMDLDAEIYRDVRGHRDYADGVSFPGTQCRQRLGTGTAERI